MTRRTSAVLRGLASLVGTLVLLVGVPVGLATLVGWPLPTSFPDGAALSQALNRGITDEFIVKALAVVAWLAWAQLALAFVVEVIAAVRNRPSRELPLAPGLQVAAARLVAGIVMLLSPLQPARAVAAESARPVPVVQPIESAEPVIDLRSAAATAVAAEPHLVAVPHSAGRTVTVERHDSYWAIAERELDDGLRWREIQALNVGRTMADGYVIGPGDEMLRAGWVLELPDGVDGPASTPAVDPVSGEVVVEPGDSLWDISEDRLAIDLEREPADVETEPYWREVMAANQDRLVDPNNPSLIYSGQVLVLPPTGHGVAPTVEEAEPAPPAPVEPAPEPEPAPTTVPPTTSTAVPSTTAPPTTAPVATTVPATDPEVAPADPDTDDEDPDSDSAFPLAVGLGALTSVAMAVGIKRLIERRRREFALTHEGEDLPEPDPDLRQEHQNVVAQADEDLVGKLQYALGELAVALAESGQRCRPRLVRHSAKCLEVLLDRPTPHAPPGWRSDGDGLVWTLDHDIELDIILDGPARPAPLMVTIGQPDEDANLYLDLEVDGLISLVGKVESARLLARSMLTELTLSPLADGNRVITIGDLVEPEAARLPQLTQHESWYDLAEDFTAWVKTSHEALVDKGWPNSFVGRGHDPDHDALGTLVVVATKPPPPELLDLLIEKRPSAVAVVVADHCDGAVATIVCDEETVRLEDLDLSFTPQTLEEGELEAMGGMICVADDDPEGDHDHREGFDLDDDPPSQPSPPEEQAPEPPVPVSPPDYEVLVRLLGDIRVEGGTKQLHTKPTAVVAYLALKREASSERLEEACWFGSNGTSHRKRLRATMTQCRDALGSQHFPSNKDGVYVIGDRIRTDTELFDWHVAHAATEEPAEALKSYREALELVTGKPFSYSNVSQARQSFGWVDFEHHTTDWELRIAAVAKAFTEICIDLDQPESAIDVLRGLLPAIPLNGDLVAALMRAYVEAGDRSAAERVFDEHSAALDCAELGEPIDAVLQQRADCDH